MLYPDIDAIKHLKGKSYHIPVYSEIYADCITSVSLLNLLKESFGYSFILESVDKDELWGRYTILGSNASFGVRGNIDNLFSYDVDTLEIIDQSFDIDKFIKTYNQYNYNGKPIFSGGFCGLFYNSEDINTKYSSNQHSNLDLLFFDKVIVIDNFRQIMQIICNIDSTDIEREYNNAFDYVNNITQMINSYIYKEPKLFRLEGQFTKSYSSKDEISNQLKILLEDQLVSSINLLVDAPFSGELTALYRTLRVTSPSTYMFYYNYPLFQLAGTSPKTLFNIKNGVLSTVLKVPREKGYYREYLVDATVDRFCSLCSFSTLMVTEYHKEGYISTVIKGELNDKCKVSTIFKSLLPPLEYTGIPSYIESFKGDCPREYSGACLGYIELSGNVDVCYAETGAYASNKKLYIQSLASSSRFNCITKDVEEFYESFSWFTQYVSKLFV